MKKGDRVQILMPAYVAGQVGEILGREMPSNHQSSDRWLIRVEAEGIVVSLSSDEFRVNSTLPQPER